VKTKYFIAIGGIVVLLLILLMTQKVKRSEHSFDTNSGATIGLKSNETDLAQAATSNTKTDKPHKSPSNLINEVTGALKQYEKEKTAIAAMNVPVNFWGRVVDQDGTSLSGVKVEMSLRQWKEESGSPSGEFLVFNRQTGANGTFDLRGENGDALEFRSINKEGYRLSPKAVTSLNFERNPNPSSANDPIIFKMWKIGASGKLLTGSKFFGIVPDGRTYTIDLIRGTKSEGESSEGDLRVKILRPSVIQERLPYDWTCVIETIGGGLIEADDDFMYQAPETGYSSPYQVKFTASQTNWTDTVKDNVYVESRGGAVYGIIHMEIIAHYQDKSVFNVSYSINPNSSRNLQPE
jgi:hypothetical protein